MRLKHGFKQYKEALKEANLGETLFYNEEKGWYFKYSQKLLNGYGFIDGEYKVQQYYINANDNIRTIRRTKRSYDEMRQRVFESMWVYEEWLRMQNDLIKL